MSVTVKERYRQLHRAAEVVQDRQLPFLAAAIAYYAFVSIVPLLIVSFAVSTVVAGETVAKQVLGVVGSFLTPEASDLLEESLVTGAGRGGVTVGGFFVLLWGGLRVFRGIDIAFSRIYGAADPKSLPAQLRDAVLVLCAIAIAVGATVLLGPLLSLFVTPFAGFAGTVSLLVLLPAVFFPLYYVFPPVDVTTREAVPGVVFAAVSWTILGGLFSLYVNSVATFHLYGVLGGVLLLLVWFYFAGLVLLLGATLNAVAADRFEDRQLQQ